MGYLLQQLANAVPLAALYAALAFGYSLAFGVTKRADITYGAMFAFAGQILLLATVLNLIGLVVNGLVILTASRIGAALSKRTRFRRAPQILLGTVFAGLAARLALGGQR